MSVRSAFLAERTPLSGFPLHNLGDSFRFSAMAREDTMPAILDKDAPGTAICNSMWQRKNANHHDTMLPCAHCACQW